MEQLWQSIKNFFLGESMINAIVRIIIAVIFLFIASKIVKIIVRKALVSKGMMKFSKTVRTFLGHVISISLYLVVAVVTVMILGFDLSALSAILASIGLAIGLALQGGLSNIAGGVMVVAFKPFEVGDYVSTNGVSGTVTDIGIFYTTLTTPDNKRVVIPNGIVSNSIVENCSTYDTRRIDFDFAISFKADIDVAKKVLYACAKMDERVLDDPAPVVLIAGHTESSTTIKLRVWVATENYWDVHFDMTEQIKRSFDQCGVKIPYPQLDVHIER